MGIKKKIDAFMKGGIIGGNTNSKMNNNNIRKNRKLAYSAVGTPDYVAPEVQSKSTYAKISVKLVILKLSTGGQWE
jgi:hypothetical protein